jgi:cysteine desulfurase
MLLSEIKKKIPNAIVNGDMDLRLPNNLNISIPDIDAEFTVIKLDAKGVAISTKSSCKKNEDSSYVVSEISKEDWRARNTLRFSFLKNATVGEAKKIAKVLSEAVNY